MSLFDRVISDALTVTPDGVAPTDIGITGGRITALAAPGTLTATQTVDAHGLVALPGGIDPHIHLDTVFGPWRTTDDFRSGTEPAAFGGTTTIIEFAIPRPGETMLVALDRCRAEATGAATVDFSLHACITADTFECSLDELARLPELGVASVKVFSTYVDSVGLSLEQIAKVLERAAEFDLLVLVHAEDDGLLAAATAKAVAVGDLGPAGHARSRPPAAEASAITAIAQLAADAGAKVFFVHVSSADGAAAVREERRAGRRVQAETCIQYLCLDDSLYDRTDGELWICAPPLRGAHDRAALWDALADGTLELVSTDHNCFTLDQKAVGHDDFRKAPNGLPGVELRLPVLFGERADGRLDWQDIAHWTSEVPARTFGMWPQKGAIAPGADADLVLVDPAGTTDLGVTHMRTDFSPFAGRVTAGAVVSTWLHGQPLTEGAELTATPGGGVWVPTRARG